MATRQIPWARIVAEGVAIVVSILLAFGIQAWWESRGEAVRRDALVQELSNNLRVTQQLIRNTVAGLEGSTHRGRAFLDLANAEHIPSLDSIRRLGEGFIAGPSPIPPLATYQAAIGSGEITLIQNQRFLEAMAEYSTEEQLLFRRREAWAESYYLGAHLQLRRRLGSLGVISDDLDDCDQNTSICPYPRVFLLDSQGIVNLLRDPEVYAYFESIYQVLDRQRVGLLRLDEAAERALSALAG